MGETYLNDIDTRDAGQDLDRDGAVLLGRTTKKREI